MTIEHKSFYIWPQMLPSDSSKSKGKCIHYSRAFKKGLNGAILN